MLGLNIFTIETKEQTLLKDGGRRENQAEARRALANASTKPNAQGRPSSTRLHDLSPAREMEVIRQLERQNRELLKRTPDMNVFATNLLKQVDRKMVGKDITCIN